MARFAVLLAIALSVLVCTVRADAEGEDAVLKLTADTYDDAVGPVPALGDPLVCDLVAHRVLLTGRFLVLMHRSTTERFTL